MVMNSEGFFIYNFLLMVMNSEGFFIQTNSPVLYNRNHNISCRALMKLAIYDKYNQYFLQFPITKKRKFLRKIIVLYFTKFIEKFSMKINSKLIVMNMYF